MSTQELRLAVVHKVIYDLTDVGKTKLQKLMYFLQETQDVPIGYPFKMHHYGPYAEALETDTARLRLAGFIAVDPDPNGYGFHITPTDEAPDENWDQFVLPHKYAVDKTIKDFGSWQTHQLELAATIHFVERLTPNSSPVDVLNKVRALKPKFDAGYVLDVHKGLAQMGIVKSW